MAFWNLRCNTINTNRKGIFCKETTKMCYTKGSKLNIRLCHPAAILQVGKSQLCWLVGVVEQVVVLDLFNFCFYSGCQACYYNPLNTMDSINLYLKFKLFPKGLLCTNLPTYAHVILQICSKQFKCTYNVAKNYWILSLHHN